MSKITSTTKIMTSTDLGLMAVELTRYRGFNIEDLLKARAVSQARRVQLINLGKNINVNNPTAERTINSIYFKNEIDLPE